MVGERVTDGVVENHWLRMVYLPPGTERGLSMGKLPGSNLRSSASPL